MHAENIGVFFVSFFQLFKKVDKINQVNFPFRFPGEAVNGHERGVRAELAVEQEQLAGQDG